MAIPNNLTSPVAHNQALIQVLKNGWQRELDKITRAEKEIFSIKLQLLELGVELPEGE